MENSIKMIKQIERTHSGCGIPMLFGNICNLANVSAFYIGEKAIGKGTVISNIKPIGVKPRFDMNLNTLNLTTMFSKLGIKEDLANGMVPENADSGVKDEKMLWRIDEWSTLQEYHRNLFLTIGAELITERRFYHVSGSPSKPIILRIDNCDLVCFIGIQPRKYGTLMIKNENWESLASDRFMKFCFVNPLRIDTTKQKPEYDFKPKLSINEIVPIKSQLTVMKMTLHNQATEDRTISYARDLIRAYCKFEGYESVTLKAEIEFKQLFGFYLTLYDVMTYTESLEDTEHFNIGAIRLLSAICRYPNSTYKELINYFKVFEKLGKEESYFKMIMEKGLLLEKNGYVSIVAHSEPHFEIGRRINEYFNWYDSIRK